VTDKPASQEIPRGAIVIVAGRSGRYTGKPRPALVVQSRRVGDTGSIVVCLITSMEIDAPLLRVPLTADASTGLEKPSWVMVEKITAVERQEVAKVIGRANRATMRAVGYGLLHLLGFQQKTSRPRRPARKRLVLKRRR
jgi:mRNA interferase MazF